MADQAAQQKTYQPWELAQMFTAPDGQQLVQQDQQQPVQQTGEIDYSAMVREYMDGKEQPVGTEGGIWDYVTKFASDVGNGIMEAPKAVATGVSKGVNELSDIGYSLGRVMNDVADTGYVNIDMNPDTPLWESQKDRDARLSSQGIDPTNANQANGIQVPEDWGSIDTNTGKLIEGLAQFSVGMVGAGRAIKMGGMAGSAIKGAVAGSTAFDPHEERLSNLINEQFPILRSPVTQSLAAKPDDTEAEGRFKSALENLGLGIGIEAFVKGVKSLKFGKAGDNAAAEQAAQEADDALKAEEVPVDDALKQGDHLPSAQEPQQLTLDLPVTEEPVIRPNAGDPVAPMADKAANYTPPFEVKPAALAEFRKALEENPNAFSADTALASRSLDFNFEAWPKDGSGGSIQSIVGVMADTLEKEFRRVKGGNADGVRSWAAVERNARVTADEFGTDPDLFLQRMASQSKDRLHMDSQILAYKTVQVGVLQELDRVANAVTNGVGYKGMAGKQLEDHMDFLFARGAEVSAMVKGHQTNVARSLNAMKLKVPGAGRLTEEFNTKNMGKTAAERARAYLAADGDFAVQNRILNASKVERVTGLYNEYWTNAVLSGLITHTTAAMTNAMNLGYQPLLRMVGGALSRDKAMLQEGFYQYMGYANSVKDATKLALKVMLSKDGEAILDPHNSSFDNISHAWDARSVGLDPKSPSGMLFNVLGQTIRMPARALITSDEFFKQMALRSRVYSVALQEARAKGMNPAQQAAHIQNKLDNAIHLKDVVEDGRLMAKAGSFNRADPLAVDAMGLARQATFTQPLERGIGQSLQEFKANHPWFHVILPFVRTPTNIIRFAWQHTPILNRTQFQHMEDIRAGGQRKAMAAARSTMGGLLWATAANYAMEGRITGYGPENPEVRKELMATGWLPYALKSTDENGKDIYISLNRLDPYGMFFGLAADATEIMSKSDDATKQDIAHALITATIRNLTSKSYLKGMSAMLDALSKPDTNLDKMLRQQAASNVPSILPNLNEDQAFHEVRSVLDAVKARIPGLSKTVDPKRNILGEVLHMPVGFGLPDEMSPMRTNGPVDDPVLNEIARLAHGIMPQPVKIGNVDLTAEQYRTSETQTAYDRLRELTGTVTLGGKTLRENLHDLITSDRYTTKLTDGVEEQGMKYDGSKLGQVQAVIGRYRERAKRQLMKENDAVNEALRTDKRNKAHAKSGHGVITDFIQQ